MLADLPRQRNRAQRIDALERLMGKERLEYWLAMRIEAELAQTRWDLLHLYWEQARHPESAGRLAEEVRYSVTARRERLAQLEILLKALADPEARTRFDPLRQISRHRLKHQQRIVSELLDKHGEAFVHPKDDLFAITASEDPNTQERLPA